MKDVYRKAAERIAKKNDYSCHVINHILGKLPFDYRQETTAYTKIFDLSNKSFDSRHLSDGTLIYCRSYENQIARMLALEFMHLWEQTGELDDLLQS